MAHVHMYKCTHRHIEYDHTLILVYFVHSYTVSSLAIVFTPHCFSAELYTCTCTVHVAALLENLLISNNYSAAVGTHTFDLGHGCMKRALDGQKEGIM